MKKSHTSPRPSFKSYSDHFDPNIITNFQKRDKMFSKNFGAQAPPVRCDYPSEVGDSAMIKLGLIVPIDTNKIPNRVNVADQFKNPIYDPTNTYTVPYLWGTTGILYRDTTIDANNVSYNMLFNPRNTKGNFSLLEEARSMLSMALLSKGFSANSTNVDEINQAIDLLLQVKQDPHFLGFDGSVNGADKVLSGMNWAAIVFNGEAMDAIAEDSTPLPFPPKEVKGWIRHQQCA